MWQWMAHAITVGNLFCGFLSIVMAFNGDGRSAAWLIVAAALLDAFDGKIARYARNDSAFGLQFDSLADLVSFGVAPGILIYLLAFREHGLAGILVSFVPVVFAAIRLARFNLQGVSEAHEFEGLSSPLQACLLASFAILNLSLWGEIRWNALLTSFVVLLGLLMVSRLPLPSLPRISLREPGYNFTKLIVLMGCVGLVAVNPPRHIFPVLTMLVVTAFIVGAVRAAHHEDMELDEMGLDEEDTATAEGNARVSGGA
ncbi:MAG: CDP-diacylglycerol--serine O-phosphatidyltransferase [bacterium]